jgi:hypothetical protein
VARGFARFQLDGLIASAPEVLRAHLLVDLIRTALVSRGAGFRVDEQQLDARSRRLRRLYAPSRAGSSCRTMSAPLGIAVSARVLRTPDDAGTRGVWVARSLHKFRLFLWIAGRVRIYRAGQDPVLRCRPRPGGGPR